MSEGLSGCAGCKQTIPQELTAAFVKQLHLAKTLRREQNFADAMFCAFEHMFPIVAGQISDGLFSCSDCAFLQWLFIAFRIPRVNGEFVVDKRVSELRTTQNGVYVLLANRRQLCKKRKTHKLCLQTSLPEGEL